MLPTESIPATVDASFGGCEGPNADAIRFFETLSGPGLTHTQPPASYLDEQVPDPAPDASRWTSADGIFGDDSDIDLGDDGAMSDWARQLAASHWARVTMLADSVPVVRDDAPVPRAADCIPLATYFADRAKLNEKEVAELTQFAAEALASLQLSGDLSS